jgi:hypothetical protein
MGARRAPKLEKQGRGLSVLLIDARPPPNGPHRMSKTMFIRSRFPANPRRQHMFADWVMGSRLLAAGVA